MFRQGGVSSCFSHFGPMVVVLARAAYVEIGVGAVVEEFSGSGLVVTCSVFCLDLEVFEVWLADLEGVLLD